MPASTQVERPPTLVVHHMNNSRSQRILWLLEELEVPYTIEYHQRGQYGLAPPVLLDIHPLGKCPVVTDGDITIAESGAIVEYILSKYGDERNQPVASAENKLNDAYWSHYAEGTLMPILVQKFIYEHIPLFAPWYLGFFLRPIFGAVSKLVTSSDMRKNLDHISAYLNQASHSMWFAGGERPTRADFMMIFPMELIKSGWADGVGEINPKIREWVDKVHERPAYQRVMQKCGTYDFY